MPLVSSQLNLWSSNLYPFPFLDIISGAQILLIYKISNNSLEIIYNQTNINQYCELFCYNVPKFFSHNSSKNFSKFIAKIIFGNNKKLNSYMTFESTDNNELDLQLKNKRMEINPYVSDDKRLSEWPP